MVISFDNIRSFLLDNCSFVSDKNIDKIVEELMKELLQNGYDLNNIEIIGYGETSINFVNNNEVIRLTFVRYTGNDMLSDYVSKSSRIAQPLDEKMIEGTGARLIKMKRYDTTNISEEDIIDTYIHLRDDDYLLFDLKPNNFGKDSEGNVFLIDYGELIYIKEKLLFLKKADLKCHAARCPKYDKIYQKYLRRMERKRKIHFLKNIKQKSLSGFDEKENTNKTK